MKKDIEILRDYIFKNKGNIRDVYPAWGRIEALIINERKLRIKDLTGIKKYISEGVCNDQSCYECLEDHALIDLLELKIKKLENIN